jgi:hypothetical protein
MVYIVAPIALSVVAIVVALFTMFSKRS